MKRHKFKKRQLERLFKMLSFESFKWQIDAVWHFYKNELKEFHIAAPRQNGKSQILVLIVLVELFLNDAKITFTSHSTKNCDEFFQKIKFEINNNPWFKKRVIRMINGKGNQLITLKGGAKISFIARTKDGGIGDSNDVIIFDEFQLMNTKQVSAIFPTLSARPDSVTIYAGTMPRAIDDDTFFRDQRKLHYGTVKWLEYGVGHEYDLNQLKAKDLFLSKQLIKKTNPSFNVMIPYENIVREFGKMDLLDYAIQRLGLFHTQTQKSLFTQNIISKVLTNTKDAQKFKGKFIVGIKFGMENHCAVIASRVDGKVYIQVLDKRPNKYGFDWLAKFILANKNIQGVMVDGMFKDSFQPMISKKFVKNYKKIGGLEYIAAQKILEQEIVMDKINIANQTAIPEELQNVTLISQKDYSKFAPLHEGTDVVVAEAMAIANHYVKERFK